MHILHLIKTSEGATWAINLLKELKLRDNTITFSVIIPPGGKHFKEYYSVCEHVYEFDYKINCKLFNLGKEFKKLVLKDKPDIIHSWFTQTTLYARLFLRNVEIPRVFQVVGPAHLENFLFKSGDIKSSQKYDYWLATSKYIYNKYKKSRVSENKLFLNYAFIDTHSLLESKEKIVPLDYKREYGLNENVKIIGTASYIYPPKFYEKGGIKGHEYLLDAFKELLKKRDDVVLIIAGATFGSNDVYESKLKKKAKEISAEKILFTGRYSNVYEVIANFDVFIYLSKSENLGGVFESLLFEVPTISSNKGALPELVINNKTGFNVEPTETNSLVEKINAILENQYPNFKKEGKKLVLNTFKKSNMIENAINIYKQILMD